jgi:hypothetical protein
MVEKGVINCIDKKLRCGRVGIPGPGHGDSTGLIFKTVVRFIFNGGKWGFGFHVFGQAAPLDHEAANDAMKDGAVIKSAFNIGQEIVYGFGCFVAIQFQYDLAVAGLKQNAWILRISPSYSEGKSDKRQNQDLFFQCLSYKKKGSGELFLSNSNFRYLLE